MLIIGERINSTRARVRKAIRARSPSYIIKEAKSQFDAGARILDINCAMGLDDEVQDIDWVTSVIQSELPEAGICIDSPNYLAIERALAVYKGKGEIFINSITLDEARISRILPLALRHKAKLIALTMDAKGMPETGLERRDIANKLLKTVKSQGFDERRLYFDPLIRPLATEPAQAEEFLDSIPLIKELGAVNTICGLSNISFGLPRRSVINSVFLSMARARGLDAAILDPLDAQVVSAVLAGDALSGDDKYCKSYLRAFREGRLR
jgi:5-methyltetrahydrofolate--homocysteine methyltransferase